jgi:hypothetical protein
VLQHGRAPAKAFNPRGRRFTLAFHSVAVATSAKSTVALPASAATRTPAPLLPRMPGRRAPPRHPGPGVRRRRPRGRRRPPCSRSRCPGRTIDGGESPSGPVLATFAIREDGTTSRQTCKGDDMTRSVHVALAGGRNCVASGSSRARPLPVRAARDFATLAAMRRGGPSGQNNTYPTSPSSVHLEHVRPGRGRSMARFLFSCYREGIWNQTISSPRLTRNAFLDRAARNGSGPCF